MEAQANWRWHPTRTRTSSTALQVRLLPLPPGNSWGCSSTGEHSVRIRAMRVRSPPLPPHGRHQQGLARGCKPRRTGSVTRGGLRHLSVRFSVIFLMPPRVDRGPRLRTSVKQFDPARWCCSGTWPNWQRHPAQTRNRWWVRLPPYRPLRENMSGRQRDAARRGPMCRSPRRVRLSVRTRALRSPAETGGRRARLARRPG